MAPLFAQFPCTFLHLACIANHEHYASTPPRYEMTSTLPEVRAPNDGDKSSEPLRQGQGGYPKLAEGMAACQTLTIFRRFSALSAENLLYLQADIIRLEKRLKRLEKEDQESGHPDRSQYFNDWFLIQDSERLSKVEGNGNSPLAA
jgi:hypothetical protein